MTFVCSVCEKSFTRRANCNVTRRNVPPPSSTNLYAHHVSPHSHIKNASINTLPPSTPHYLTDSYVPPVHIHSPIQITSIITNNSIPHPNITSAHCVLVPSSVSTLSAYTKNHASLGESVQPPPLYQHHQIDKLSK